MNLSDEQLQLLYLHARIFQAYRVERLPAVTALGLLLQVLSCIVIHSTGKNFFIKSLISNIWFKVTKGI